MKFYKRMMLLILVVSVFILGCETGNEINYENTLETRSNNTDLPNPFINIEEFQNNNLTPYVEPNTTTDSLNLVGDMILISREIVTQVFPFAKV